MIRPYRWGPTASGTDCGFSELRIALEAVARLPNALRKFGWTQMAIGAAVRTCAGPTIRAHRLNDPIVTSRQWSASLEHVAVPAVRRFGSCHFANRIRRESSGVNEPIVQPLRDGVLR